MTQARQAVELQRAETLQAPQQDVDIAKASVPVEQQPEAASTVDVDNLRNTIKLSNTTVDNRDNRNRDWNDPALRHDRDDRDWNRNVRQWDPRWVRYDEYYRPILCNPFHHTLRVVYIYERRPRILLIPALASVVVSSLAYGAYSFTAAVLDTLGTVADLAVGSFFGYYPGPYLAPPPPPPPLLTYNDVPVVVNYRDATYEPFTVRRIVDVGDDAQYGERKVLLDGATPAWGVWSQTPDGQRQFVVHKTQQLPGMDDPQEGPLPGNYQLRLASSPSGITTKALFIMIADAVVATLALCAAAAFVISRRRSRSLH